MDQYRFCCSLAKLRSSSRGSFGHLKCMISIAGASFLTEYPTFIEEEAQMLGWGNQTFQIGLALKYSDELVIKLFEDHVEIANGGISQFEAVTKSESPCFSVLIKLMDSDDVVGFAMVDVQHHDGVPAATSSFLHQTISNDHEDLNVSQRLEKWTQIVNTRCKSLSKQASEAFFHGIDMIEMERELASMTTE